DVSPGNNFQYNRNPHAGVYAIQRLDRETGRRSTWLQQTGSAMRPQLLPDGGTMAYLSRLFVARHGARGLRSSPKTLPAALPPQHVPVYDVFECFSTCTTVWFRRSATTPK
ncbi:MAG TPA: hypothetical protein VE869_04955, partial [Gemmatimonas sp.]|nr:hypothetical protein [Gemmatimonas sp.]